MNRHRVTAVTGLVLALMATTRAAHGQHTSNRAFILGVTAAGYYAQPYGGLMGAGGLVGMEQQGSDHLSLRAVATLLRGVRTSDDISICYGNPDVGCLPDPVFPLWLSTVEVHGIIALFSRVPVHLIGGAGFSVASEPRTYQRSAPRLPLGTETQLVWRAGLDVRLGSAPRSPRLQFTRSGFGSNAFSLSRIHALTVLIRP